MNASAEVLHSRWGKIREHAELIAALLSGVLILVAWLLSENKIETWSIITFLLAFAIGGYAKAKEGIKATIEDKKLNVEILMILAAVGSAIIGYWTEGAILIFIFALIPPCIPCAPYMGTR